MWLNLTDIPDAAEQIKVSESMNAWKALEARWLVTWEFTKDMAELVEEWVPQVSSFVERNPIAMNMFFDANFKDDSLAYV